LTPFFSSAALVSSFDCLDRLLASFFAFFSFSADESLLESESSDEASELSLSSEESSSRFFFLFFFFDFLDFFSLVLTGFVVLLAW
jgi:hypothetical protein